MKMSKPDAAVAKVDGIRERELHRYYLPFNPKVEKPKHVQNTLGVSIATSPDTTLTALAQLCAVRLNASRAMISVIGKQTQYFLAESTKTLDLLDNQKSEQEDDGLWIGCSQVGKEGRLCEKTIELLPIPGEFPCFVVSDLSKDGRFNKLPFVTGPPSFKYYAGTPLTTEKGINIGSLFILDTVVRPQLTTAQQSFLGSIAQIVMDHMETTREAIERRKVMRMSRGLNAFVEGKSYFGAEDYGSGGGNSEIGKSANNKTNSGQTGVRKEYQHTMKIERRSSSADSSMTEQARVSSKSTSLPPNPYSQEVPETARPLDEDILQSGSDADQRNENKDIGHKSTIKRAANLLRQSLDLQPGSGVVFLDTAMGLCGHDEGPILLNDAVNEDSEGGIDPLSHTRRNSVILSPATFHHDCPGNTRTRQKPADVIGFSVSEAAVSLQEVPESPRFTPLGEDLLQYLLKRYPRGNLWNFDEDGNLSSSEEEIISNESKSLGRRQVQNQKRLSIATMLQKHFLGVCQLLFAPLWDSAASRWFSGCFVFNYSNSQIFSREAELNFVTAFNNSVMAEVSRLASIAADRQKGDFIGSISHEFRSPLHGILASAEFLSEIEADAFQSRLVDTILSCGRTLLDTINHILDFSKINSFEWNWRRARKPGARRKKNNDIKPSTTKDELPLVNIYEITNVAAMAEEVIEGVYAGQMYQDISSTDITDTVSGSRLRRSKRRSSSGIEFPSGENAIDFSSVKEIEVILDFEHKDFTFSTQPGAFRRIIMNIFGNALKYTLKGTIIVKLALSDMHDPTEVDSTGQMLKLTIEDTGKGISAEYLRTSLYTPFCQEDVLASGTGLGLSIVRSIVNILGGSIAIRSQIGQGTEVTISIPMMRASENGSPSSTPSLAGTIEASHDDTIRTLRAKFSHKTVALYGIDLATESGHVLREYVSRWFGLEVLSSLSASKPVDIILVDEKLFSALKKTNLARVSTLVFCTHVLRYNRKEPHLDDASTVDFVSKPYGPLKLAKVLRSCFEKAQSHKPILESMGLVNLSDEVTEIGLSLTSKNGSVLQPAQNNDITDGKSVNAQVISSLPNNEIGPVSPSGEYPFPVQKPDPDATQDDALQNRRRSIRPALSRSVTESSTKTFPSSMAKKSYSDPIDRFTPTSFTSAPIVPQQKRPPRILLVDDNSINLRLLEMYLRKRKQKLVDSAENGQIAVRAAEKHPEGYDIIFMDITMPIMNGFEATRTIREIEQERGIFRATEGGTPTGGTTPALIVALTGLASGRDQTEAFASGVDMYMTKPVSFKEVGQLLDNWEANGGNGIVNKETV